MEDLMKCQISPRVKYRQIIIKKMTPCFGYGILGDN